MANEITISEVAKLTGLDVEILHKMRTRESITLNSGPPFCKSFDRSGRSQYFYKKNEVLRWLKHRKFRITAGDAAAILKITRQELLARYGNSMHSWEGDKGKLIICAGKNIFVWIPRLVLDNEKDLDMEHKKYHHWLNSVKKEKEQQRK